MMTTLFDAAQASEYLGVPLPYLKRLRERREIAFVRLGHRTIRFLEEDLAQFVAKRRVSAHADLEVRP